MIIATVGVVQQYCVLWVDFRDYTNSRYSAMLLCFVQDIVVTATEVVEKWYCDMCGVFNVVTAIEVLVQ